jgi:preprotein translocase subunit SecA
MNQGPVLPFPEDEEEEEETDGEPAPDASEQQRIAAKTTMEDFTRNVQRKKEREMAELQFLGGEADSSPQQVASGAKIGRNDPCPCGSGKKYKKCHGT